MNTNETQSPGSLERMVSALALLGLNGDKIFARICEELERGDRHAARQQLNFVDAMLEKRANAASERHDEAKPRTAAS